MAGLIHPKNCIRWSLSAPVRTVPLKKSANAEAVMIIPIAR